MTGNKFIKVTSIEGIEQRFSVGIIIMYHVNPGDDATTIVTAGTFPMDGEPSQIIVRVKEAPEQIDALIGAAGGVVGVSR